jgi:hypothetical protein
VTVKPICSGGGNVVVASLHSSNPRYSLGYDRFKRILFRMAEQPQWSFEKFVDSPYYSELELCGGAVTISSSNKVSPRTFQTALVLIYHHRKYRGNWKK